MSARSTFDNYGNRLKEGAKRATVNRELSALRRSLRLGIEAELISVAVPLIEKLPENNVRVGRISDEIYCAIMSHLPEHQQIIWCYAYRLGVRKGELLKIRVEWLLPYWNREEPFIKIPGFDEKGNRITKSGKPHTIPLYHSELRAFTEMALDRRDPRCPWLFQYGGKRLKNIRTGFEKACKDAGRKLREFEARPKQFASGINEEEAKARIGAVGNYMNGAELVLGADERT